MSGFVNTQRAWARTQSRSAIGVSPSKDAGRTVGMSKADTERS
jgi:hypothetical protein